MTTAIEPIERALRPVSGMAAWKRELSRLKQTMPPFASAAVAKPTHQRILIPMLVGSSDLFAAREGLIAHALRMRGADVLFVLCDGLTACDARTFDSADQNPCSGCHFDGADNLARFGHSAISLSSFVTRERVQELHARAQSCSVSELLSHPFAGIDLGGHVYSSTLRYFRAGRFCDDEPDHVARARDYLGSALVMTEATRNAYRALKPDKIFSSHGLYASWGPWSDLAKALNIPCDTYAGGWRRNTLLCQHDSHSFAHADEIWEHSRDVPLTDAQEDELSRYLDSRETHREESFRYFDEVDRDIEKLFERVGAVGTWKTRTGLFANVAWDSARYRQEGVFGEMFRWAAETARFYGEHPEHLLLIKAHPAESNFREQTPSRWTIRRILEEELGTLPANVKIIPAEDNVSNFAFSRVLDIGLTHTSNAGLELALLGVPVMTSGAGVHYEKEGVVVKAQSGEHYFETLQHMFHGTPPSGPDPSVVRRYAHTIYFRKSLPFDVIDVEGWSPEAIAIDSLAELAPGRFAGLDALCDGILNGAPLALS